MRRVLPWRNTRSYAYPPTPLQIGIGYRHHPHQSTKKKQKTRKGSPWFTTNNKKIETCKNKEKTDICDCFLVFKVFLIILELPLCPTYNRRTHQRKKEHEKEWRCTTDFTFFLAPSGAGWDDFTRRLGKKKTFGGVDFHFDGKRGWKALWMPKEGYHPKPIQRDNEEGEQRVQWFILYMLGFAQLIDFGSNVYEISFFFLFCIFVVFPFLPWLWLWLTM